MSRVVHFEIHAEKPERAAAFYRDVFGWEAKKWGGEDYWLVTTGPDAIPGINGGIVLRRGPAPLEDQPVNAYVCTIQVASLEVGLEKVKRAGGIQVVDIVEMPNVGRFAYCKDTEGNIFGMLEPPRT